MRSDFPGFSAFPAADADAWNQFILNTPDLSSLDWPSPS